MMQLKEETLMKLLDFLGVDSAAADLDAEVMAALDDTVGEYEVSEMQNRISTLEGELVNRDLDAHGITDAEERKTWTVLLNADREAGLKALSNRKADSKKVYQPLTNRHAAQTPAGSGSVDTRSLRNRAVQEFQSAHGCGFEPAWNAVRALKPELFKEGI